MHLLVVVLVKRPLKFEILQLSVIRHEEDCVKISPVEGVNKSQYAQPIYIECIEIDVFLLVSNW